MDKMAPRVKREIYITHVQAFGRLLVTLRGVWSCPREVVWEAYRGEGADRHGEPFARSAPTG